MDENHIIRNCNTCKLDKLIEEFHFARNGKGGRKSSCKTCAVQKTKDYYRNNYDYRERARERSSHTSRLKRYGLTQKQYEIMIKKQNGVCAICFMNKGKKSLAVDHNHETGKIRGLLCMNCNTAIGRLDDDVELLQRAIDYLKRYS